MLSLVGSGTYFGLTFVFLKSKPTNDVPLGRITPPSILFSLYNSLFGDVKSKFEFTSNGGKSFVIPPFLK